MDIQRDKSLSSLFSELTRETTTLFRKEVDLAKAELSEKVSLAGSGVAELVAGAIIAFVGVQALVAAGIIALALVVEWWLAAVIVGGAVLIVGLIVVWRGMANLKARHLVPRRTIGSVRDTSSWARQQLR